MPETVEVKGRIVEERELSVFFAQTGGYGLTVSLPRAAITVKPGRGDKVSVTLPAGRARKKQLI